MFSMGSRCTYTEPAVEYPAFEEPQYTTFELTDQDVASRPELISSALPEETESVGTGCKLRKVTEALEGHLSAEMLRKDLGDVAGAHRTKTPGQKARSLMRRIRLRDWKRRRLAFLSHIHRHVFDRKTEQLLFRKTPLLDVYHVEEQKKAWRSLSSIKDRSLKSSSTGPLPALPHDLKRHAFVDFRAGNGRTLPSGCPA